MTVFARLLAHTDPIESREGDPLGALCGPTTKRWAIPRCLITSLDSKVQLDRHQDVDWHVGDTAGRKPPLPNGRDRFLIEPSWIE